MGTALTLHLDQQSQALLRNELFAALPLKAAKDISAMTIPTARQSVEAQIRAYGSLITRAECDACLADLALIVPRAGLDRDSVDRMLDLYFGLLRKNGVTKQILMSAQEAFIMAPRKGKPRFFPDPGELFELCADEARNRAKSLSALQRALDVLNGGSAPLQIEEKDQDRAEMAVRLKALSASMRTKGGGVVHAERCNPTALKGASTSADTAGLVAALEKHTGKPLAQLRKEMPTKTAA